MKKALLFLPVILFIVGALAYVGYGRLTGANQMYKAPDPNKVNVITTIYPLGDFARNIGGKWVSVTVATPPGIEPHDFEPTPRQVAFMLEADVFVMNGGGLDDWADDIASQVRERGGKVVNMEEIVEFRSSEEEEHEDEEHEGEDGHEGGLDPHIWLDLLLAQDMARYIRYAFIEVDGEHRDEYLAKTDAYLSELAELDGAFKNGLATCEKRDIFVSHDAYSYLGARYNFTIHSLLGLSPDEEPSAKDLGDLSMKAKELGIKTIFFETLVSSKLAKTLAREIGAETKVLNPVENLTLTESLMGESYVGIMEKNLTALRGAMLCQ